METAKHNFILACALACALPFLVGLSGFATEGQRVASPASLTGANWELVAIQSMDDAQGTVRPAEPARYTLEFGADGRVAVRLDCNRGSATWQAQPAA